MRGFQESLDYLYGLQRFGIKLGLDNIRTLLARLGHPEGACPCVHVAGTNGKGSVAATLAAILSQAGLRTGLYTSPHLHHFTERIRIDGEMIPVASVVALTREIRAAATDLNPTFFEFTTVMALLHFQRSGAGFAVLEVGMGGRLDATNVVTPQVAVITPVSLDHQSHLGADLTAIAGEKGGIIKPGVPVVLGAQEPAALSALLRIAGDRQAPVFCWDRDFGIVDSVYFFHQTEMQLHDLVPALAGAHQRENLAMVVATVALLRRQGYAISDAAIRRGVAATRWPGRLEWWGDERRLLLDGAHNHAGALALAAYLRESGVDGVRLVIGIKGDKTAAEILAPLLPYAVKVYCTVPPVDEPVPPAQLAAIAADHAIAAAVYPTGVAALAAAQADRRGSEAVVVAGSLFLVAAVRETLLQGELIP